MAFGRDSNQRSMTDPATAALDAPYADARHDGFGGAPSALPPEIRGDMERSFDTDLSSVRLHHGGEAAAMGAQAFTRGDDIHFAPGHFDPETRGGRELIGHEVAHVVQQRAGRADGVQHKDGPSLLEDAALEAEADVAGARAARGEPAGISSSATSTASAVVQRKAAVGHDAHESRNPAQSDAVQQLIEDDVPRRFNDEAELLKFSQGGTVEGVGQLAGGPWIKLPPRMLVLGEDHADPLAVGIINAVHTRKFRYEGYSRHDSELTDRRGNEELKAQTENIDGARPEHGDLVEHDDHRDHSAEHAEARYARALAEIEEIAAAQTQGRSYNGVVDEAGDSLGEKYTSKRALVHELLPALLYVDAFDAKPENSPLKKFQARHAGDLTASIEVIREAVRANQMVSFARMPITPFLGELREAYTTQVRSMIGLGKLGGIGRFKDRLDLDGELNVTNSKHAKELDYVRDKSMLRMIQEASEQGDRVFVIGDAHRKKLMPLIKGLGLPAMSDQDFIEQQRVADDPLRGVSAREREQVNERIAMFANPSKNPFQLAGSTSIGKTFSIKRPHWEPDYRWEVQGADHVGEHDYVVTHSRVVVTLRHVKGGDNKVVFEKSFGV